MVCDWLLVSSVTDASETVKLEIVGFWSSVFVIDTVKLSDALFPAASATRREYVCDAEPYEKSA